VYKRQAAGVGFGVGCAVDAAAAGRVPLGEPDGDRLGGTDVGVDVVVGVGVSAVRAAAAVAAADAGWPAAPVEPAAAQPWISPVTATSPTAASRRPVDVTWPGYESRRITPVG
jgi:hypothetical protein